MGRLRRPTIIGGLLYRFRDAMLHESRHKRRVIRALHADVSASHRRASTLRARSWQPAMPRPMAPHASLAFIASYLEKVATQLVLAPGLPIADPDLDVMEACADAAALFPPSCPLDGNPSPTAVSGAKLM